MIWRYDSSTTKWYCPVPGCASAQRLLQSGEKGGKDEANYVSLHHLSKGNSLGEFFSLAKCKRGGADLFNESNLFAGTGIKITPEMVKYLTTNCGLKSPDAPKWYRIADQLNTRREKHGEQEVVYKFICIDEIAVLRKTLEVKRVRSCGRFSSRYRL